MSPRSDTVDILVIHPRDPAAPTIGGIQTFLRDFIKYSPPDFRISIAGLTRDPAQRPVGRWLPLELHGREVRFLALGLSSGLSRNPLSLAATGVAVVRLWHAARRRDQILQLHRPYRRFLLARHGGPTVQFIHLDLRDWPGPSGWPKLRGLYRNFSDAELERMDRVFVVNEPGAILLRQENPRVADRIEFLPVWYDEDVFHPVLADERTALRAQLAARLGLDPATATSARFILLAVRLTEIKKPLLAIETLASLNRTTHPAARLVVAGSGELLDDARARAVQLGVAERVHFLGDVPREEVAQLMQAADCLLLTARSEGGGPRVVLEALACGLPVVSTTVVEIRRTVEPGVNGWLVDEATPEALAAGLTWVLDQPSGSLAPAAMSAAAPFTARRMLAGLYDTYRALVA